MMFLGFFFYFYFKGTVIQPNWLLLMVPVLIIQTALLSFGFGLTISSMTTKYKDLKFLVAFGLQLWMYATPIVYPMSQIPEKWEVLFLFNPMASIVETFRYAFLGSGEWDLNKWLISLSITFFIFIFGVFSFNKTEKDFVDRI